MVSKGVNIKCYTNCVNDIYNKNLPNKDLQPIFELRAMASKNKQNN